MRSPAKARAHGGAPSPEGPGRAAAVGLTADEYERIARLLGREPNDVELGLFGGMWSEHCSYKSSRIHLRNLPSTGPAVLLGPGENAGVVRLDGGWALALRVESHNHPSAVEPYQGAATGVGGIIRDILTMGARPIAVLDSLRFGPPAHAPSRGHFRGVVAGVGGYGNCLGVPTVGGETVFEPGFEANPLVNVMCAGLVPAADLVRGRAEGPGNRVLLLGAPTGRDGIHGASLLASRELVADDDQRPAVQVGDPFHAKRLVEACLALARSGRLVGMNDLGAAGLTSALSETASRGGAGVDVHLDRVPLREPGMSPYEILLSETQERMVAIVAPEDVAEARRLCQAFEVSATEIGEVTDTGRLRVFHGGQVVADVPAAFLTDEAPRYDRPARAPEPVDDASGGASGDAGGPATAPAVWGATDDALADGAGTDWTAELIAFLASPWLCSRKPVYRTYDSEVQARTVLGPGHDAAVLRILGEPPGWDLAGAPSGGRAAPAGATESGVALTLDGDSRRGRLDPRQGGAAAVAEACRNLACVGAKPLAVADCLNFASPERPETMWAFRECLLGVAEAARALSAPVVGGNVSFYNETGGVPIPPTPVVGAAGRVPSVAAIRRALCPESLAGREIWLAGDARAALAASAYQLFREGAATGSLPPLDLDLERRVQALARMAARRGWALPHDVSDGGLATALFEMTRMVRTRLSAEVGEAPGTGVDAVLPPSGDAATALFGEGASRILFAVAEGRLERLRRAAVRLRVPLARLGVFTGDGRFRLRRSGPEWTGGEVTVVVEAACEDLRRAWEGGLDLGVRALA